MEEAMLRIRMIALVVLMLALVGCGDGIRRVPVKGQFKANGTPVEGAFVLFIPQGSTKGEGGIGKTDHDGNFTLTGMKQVVGVSPGEYTVRISRLLARDGKPLPEGATEADNPGCWESIPPPYCMPNSPLKVTVPDSGGTVNVEIPKKALSSPPRR
jgi:hypothetical protein